MLNRADIIGRLTRDPELRYTPTGRHPVLTATHRADAMENAAPATMNQPFGY